MFEPLAAEIAFSHFVQTFSSASLDNFFLAITFLGDPRLWIGLSAFIYWQGNEKKSFFLTTTLLFVGALVGILKPTLGRIRPSSEEFRVLVDYTDMALPSGHATTIAGIFGYYWEKFRENARVLGLLVVLLVLLSRIYLGVHFVGDVMIGGLFGFLIGRMVHWMEQKYTKIKFNQKKLLQEIGLGITIILAIIISLTLRSFALGSGLLGYFAGVFAFKLLEKDQEKVKGKKLWVKEIIGFTGLGILGILAFTTEFEAEALFLGGLWITLIYPIIFEKLLK